MKDNEPPAREAWKAMQALVMGDGEQRKREVAEELGMPFGHVRALFRAAGHDGSTMGDLAVSMGCEASYVTSVIDNLEQHALVTRQAHPRDRRIKVVVPTAEGLALVKRAEDMMWDPPSAFEALSVEEQRQLRDLVAKLSGTPPRP